VWPNSGIHRTLRAEFDTRQMFASLQVAQQALDEWVAYYNTTRPHQALSDATPIDRFSRPLANQEHGPGTAPPVAPARAVINSARATDTSTGDVRKKHAQGSRLNRRLVWLHGVVGLGGLTSRGGAGRSDS
jgi:hypothetical protein